MRRPRPESTVRENNIVGVTGPKRPDEFFSRANTYPNQCQSILQANVQARAMQKEQEHAMRHGAMPTWDPKVHEVRTRYRREVVDAGFATHDKCCDDIC